MILSLPLLGLLCGRDSCCIGEEGRISLESLLLLPLVSMGGLPLLLALLLLLPPTIGTLSDSLRMNGQLGLAVRCRAMT